MVQVDLTWSMMINRISYVWMVLIDDLRWFIFRGQTGQGELHTNFEESLRCNTIHALHAGPMEVHIKGRDCILSNPQLLALMDAITVENWWQLLRSHRNGGIPAEAAGGAEQADQAQSSAKKCLLCWLYVLRGLLCMDLLNLSGDSLGFTHWSKVLKANTGRLHHLK